MGVDALIHVNICENACEHSGWVMLESGLPCLRTKISAGFLQLRAQESIQPQLTHLRKKTVLPSGAGSGLIFYHCGGSILRGKGKIEVVLQADSRITISGGWGLNCIVRKYSHIPPQQPRQKEFIFRNRLRKASQIREYISGRFRWCYCLGWKVASEKRFSWWYGPFTSPGYLSCPEDPLNVWQRPVCHVK